jgi:hypothetical protein
MKSIVTVIAAGLLAGALAMSADAATKKKYSAVHFLKRRDYVKNCMHQKT